MNSKQQAPPNTAKPQCTSVTVVGRHAGSLRDLIQVSAVRLGNRLAGQRAAHQGERDVEQHAGQQHRHQQEGQLHAVESAGDDRRAPPA